MLELRIRACHVHGRFVAKDNRRPAYTLQQALENPHRDTSRIVLPPASFQHEKEKIERRWPAAVEFIQAHVLNEFFDGPEQDLGIVLQGGMYNGAIRALERLGLADAFGNSRIPLYVLNVTYPLVDAEVVRFCAGKRAVLLIEEGQPDYIEQALHTILRKADVQTRVSGKDVLPMAGEYTGDVLVKGVREFLRRHAPHLCGDAAAPVGSHPAVQALSGVVPQRPAGFCTGCPERPIFTAMKMVEKEVGPMHVSADIGCHLFSILPPFNIGNTTMGYGLGGAAASAFNVPAGKKAVAIMGDGGFWHNGLTSGIGNAVFNRSDGVTLVVDNGYSAATGGQDLLSSRADNRSRNTNHPIEQAVRGVGVKSVTTITRTYDLEQMRKALKDAVSGKDKGHKVIVAQSECMLNKQRRVKPLMTKAIKAGERVVRERFVVDADTCTGDHACIRMSGCPSLTIKPNPDPLRVDPVTHIEDSCVGCGLCGEAAHAAALCPSFMRADIVYNPSGWERFWQKVRGKVIGALQARTARRLDRFAF
jgi:indolepyruvate ferredoxin oxidoreductase alpha subunit